MEPLNENSAFNLFKTTTAKMIFVGLLILALLIPLEYVKSLIQERSNRKKEVVDEVTETWGKDINFYGIVLKIPYTYQDQVIIQNIETKQTEYKTETYTSHVYFFPEMIQNETTITKDNSLKRGLYSHIVYSADLDFDGYFITPDFSKYQINPENILWDKSEIIIKTSNLKSIKSELKLDIENEKFPLDAIQENQSNMGILSTPLFDFNKISKDGKLKFKLDLKFNGSNTLQFLPIAKTTGIKMKSNWESPSFIGSFSSDSDSKKIDQNGFEANWNIFQINRPISSSYLDQLPELNDYYFGVKLIETVDQYQQNERASKYGFLVITLTFLVFIIIQTSNKITINIMNYLLIGLALIMFYTLLIAITEHSSFKIAYIISALSVIVMIGLYSKSILNNPKFSVFVSLSLISLYTFIYVLLQLENYSLLVGSIGLFLILGLVMYITRKIDWNK